MTEAVKPTESRLQSAVRILDERTRIAQEQIMNEKREQLQAVHPNRTEQEIEALLSSLDDESLMRIQSESTFRALKAVANGVSRTGQTFLAGLWRAKLNKMSMYIEENASVYSALRSVCGDDVDDEYIKSMARVVEIFDASGKEQTSIFQYVYSREEIGKPVKDPKTGKIITLKEEDDEFHVNLISSPGMISKLKENAFHFTRLKTNEERDVLLSAIGRGESREYVKAVKDEQKSDAAPAHITVKEVEKDGMVNVKFVTTEFILTTAQWKKMKKRLDGVLEFEI